MKRFLMLLAIVCLIGSVAAVNQAYAIDPGWYTCTVVQGGVGWGNASPTLQGVSLTHAGTPVLFSNAYYLLDSTRAKELLAVALTAMANSRTVNVYLPGDQFGTIQMMWLSGAP